MAARHCKKVLHSGLHSCHNMRGGHLVPQLHQPPPRHYPKRPFGGGHSTMRFSLKVLFEEHLRHLNFWTRSNQDLELVRYFRCSFRFYRDQHTDYLVHYSRKTPLGGNRLTAPSLHPGVQMLSKNKIIVPSYDTKPKGKRWAVCRDLVQSVRVQGCPRS